jgi:hypothetical protein
MQSLQARIETLCGQALASLSSEAAVLPAGNISGSDLGEHLLVEALPSAARSQRADDRLDLARLRASDALALSQVGLGTSDPATAACSTELGTTREAVGDITAAQASYREAPNAGEGGRSTGQAVNPEDLPPC